jgi:uracil-DNA glycosylase family 4
LPGADAAGRHPAPAGAGWPGDPATRRTPIAADAAEVRGLAASARTLATLDARVSVCRACPRLVAWRERTAAERRRAYADEDYWGRPVPGWGDPAPEILVVGLAPAAHGGNRTGRIFTGDRSGDWLYAALHRAGLAAQPTSVHAGDGQRLTGARVTAAVHCAPPGNAPTPAEQADCAPWLVREIELTAATVAVALGGLAWRALLLAYGGAGWVVPRPRPAFAHGAQVQLRCAPGRSRPRHDVELLGCYHPSQQNTFTGRLTEPMLDEVLARAVAAISGGRPRR